MLGPEASLKAKLRLETRVVELLEETTKKPPQREEPDPCNCTQSSATSVSTFDRRTRLCTNHSCDENTSIMVTNEMQRLFFIGISVHEPKPLTNNNNNNNIPYFEGPLGIFCWYISSYCMFWSKRRARVGLYREKFLVRTVKRFRRGPLRVAL